MIDVANLQRKVRIDTGEIRRFVANLRAVMGDAEGRTFSIALISNTRMIELNKMFRGKNTTTDVLSFPMSEPPAVAGGLSQRMDDVQPPATAGGTDFLGDIVISAEQALKQADENGLDLETEVKQLILHGVLHLCGYDHEKDNGEMNARELELRETLGI